MQTDPTVSKEKASLDRAKAAQELREEQLRRGQQSTPFSRFLRWKSVMVFEPISLYWSRCCILLYVLPSDFPLGVAEAGTLRC